MIAKGANKELTEQVALDILSVFPLVFRRTRRQIIKTSLAEIDGNITPLHFEIIKLLEDQGPLHLAMIGEKLEIAKAQMTQLINRLVDMRMVERRTDISDRRITHVFLTGKGKTIFKEYKNQLKAALQEEMSHLTDDDLRELSVALKKIRDIFSKLQ
jgi:DNA-binding MarR family transcriptional regulator